MAKYSTRKRGTVARSQTIARRQTRAVKLGAARVTAAGRAR